jgi:hypothetical protein
MAHCFSHLRKEIGEVLANSSLGAKCIVHEFFYAPVNFWDAAQLESDLAWLGLQFAVTVKDKGD